MAKALMSNPNNVVHGRYTASRAERPLSFKLADFPVPTGREEEWRFVPRERISAFFATQATGMAPRVTAEGISLETVGRDDPRVGTVQPPEDRLGALAWEGFTHAHVATIPAQTQLAQEAWIRVTGSASTASSAPAEADAAPAAGDPAPAETPISAAHLVIRAEEGSAGTIIVSHTGSGYLTEGMEVQVAAGAQLTLVLIQEWDDAAKHALSVRTRMHRDAVLKQIVVSLGGDLVRVTNSLDYADKGADAQLIGAYFAHAGQHLEHRLFVDHNQPQCRSNVIYKGALQGEGAHSVWVGDVLIEPQAEDIETYELNRNLALSKGARADSVPNLEIETGKIKGAGHASATGRFDDQQLFYLQSRGIPEKEARRLVVMGFFAELINQIGVPSAQQALLNHLEAELDEGRA